ncbi:hypothetical protein JZ751_009537 [Albula glossodonta]|uniref:Alpha-catulin n=1 Tax=Albula glossodonta TaxID=121402 RepID=A0A8T2P8P3_9TELE|nr:hypothetical protein JZ751_009537 [Albula glossodonta]
MQHTQSQYLLTYEKGDTIARLTDVASAERLESEGRTTVFSDRTGMVKAARMLLSSVTKVLVLADRIVIKQIISSRNKDLKDERKKARMAAARAVLEKCTMMLLTASKTCLRHPDCESARINKDAVFQRMRFALELVIQIVTDTRPSTDPEVLPVSIYSGIRDFKAKVEGLRAELYCLSGESLAVLLERITEQTEDFTDSAYTSHEHREGILQLCHLARQELGQLCTHWAHSKSLKAKEATEEMEISILKTCQSMSELRQELHRAAVGPAVDLLKYHADHTVLKALKVSGGEGNLEGVAEYSCRLTEQKEQLVETCRLLRHVSGTEPLEITCLHAEDTFQVIGPQIISAAQTLALHPSSKIAKENLEVFCEAWESQLSDMSILLREITDVFEGRRGEKRAYLSLPRAGEQSTVAKLGLELRLMTSDLDAESEKWDDQEHEIIRQAQSIGEGLLKTTLDLFHQAEVFSEEGFRLCSSLRSLSTQVGDEEKVMIISETEKLLTLCQQLQVTARTAVQGKSATFLKVESSIQNTKGILAIVVYLLPVCQKLIRKYQSESSSLCSPQSWREKHLPSPVSEEPISTKSTNGFGVKSLEHHMANLTFLESK